MSPQHASPSPEQAALDFHQPHAGPGADRQRVAVVGGGIAGIAAARTLLERGHEVLLFEGQGRLGGQLCSVAGPEGLIEAGCPTFTAQTPEFQALCQQAQSLGLLRQDMAWPIVGGRLQEQQTAWQGGGRGLLAFAEWLAQPLTPDVCQLGRAVTGAERQSDGRWVLLTTDKKVAWPGFFDVVIWTQLPAFAEPLRPLGGAPLSRLHTWSVSASWPGRWPERRQSVVPGANAVGDDLFGDKAVLMAQRQAQPGFGESWVWHMTAEWSQAMADETPAYVAKQALAELERLAGLRLSRPVSLQAKLWTQVIRGQGLSDRFHAWAHRPNAVVESLPPGVERAWWTGVFLARLELEAQPLVDLLPETHKAKAAKPAKPRKPRKKAEPAEDAAADAVEAGALPPGHDPEAADAVAGTGEAQGLSLEALSQDEDRVMAGREPSDAPLGAAEDMPPS